jgi:hypothetical protein
MYTIIKKSVFVKQKEKIKYYVCILVRLPLQSPRLKKEVTEEKHFKNTDELFTKRELIDFDNTKGLRAQVSKKSSISTTQKEVTINL